MSVHVGPFYGSSIYVTGEFADGREEFSVEQHTFFEFEWIGDDVVFTAVRGGLIHEDDDVCYSRFIGAVWCGHVGAAAVVEGAVASFEWNGDAWCPFQIGLCSKKDVVVACALCWQISITMGAGDESHATAFNRYVA